MANTPRPCCWEVVRYNRPPRHFLYFLPLPQGHGSLRPMRGPLLRIGFAASSSPRESRFVSFCESYSPAALTTAAFSRSVAIDKCLFKELAQPQGRVRTILRPLQFWPSSFVNQGDASDGSGIDESHLELERTNRSSTRIIAYLFG